VGAWADCTHLKNHADVVGLRAWRLPAGVIGPAELLFFITRDSSVCLMRGGVAYCQTIFIVGEHLKHFMLQDALVCVLHVKQDNSLTRPECSRAVLLFCKHTTLIEPSGPVATSACNCTSSLACKTGKGCWRGASDGGAHAECCMHQVC
jgi:hypothetical protein